MGIGTGMRMGIGRASAFTVAAVVAAAIGMGPGRALACEPVCGGHGHAPPYHAAYAPPVYAPPPPYAYAYAPEYPVYAPPPPVQVNYYYSRRVTVVRRPRRAYWARWHPRACRAGCRRVKACGRRW